jgi:hypothetical protein
VQQKNITKKHHQNCGCRRETKIAGHRVRDGQAERKIPSTNLQAPEKLQAPNPKNQRC